MPDGRLARPLVKVLFEMARVEVVEPGEELGHLAQRGNRRRFRRDVQLDAVARREEHRLNFGKLRPQPV
jgi:hypothetical protein